MKPQGSAGRYLRCAGSTGPWQLGWASHVGLRHARQGLVCEDSVAARWVVGSCGQGLHAVCADGVSGGARGDLAAAAMAGFAANLQVHYPPPEGFDTPSEAARTFWSARDALASQLAQGEEVVQKTLRQHAPGRSGATTFSAAWLNAQGLGWVCRVGDCRVYHWRITHGANGPGVDLQLAAPDQTYAELAELPAPGIPLGNPARMVGNGHMGEPELRPVRLLPGDGLLLCSDGVHGTLSHDCLRALLMRAHLRAQSPLRFAQTLQRQARANGSTDDVTALVLRFTPPGGTHSRRPHVT